VSSPKHHWVAYNKTPPSSNPEQYQVCSLCGCQKIVWRKNYQTYYPNGYTRGGQTKSPKCERKQ